MEELDSRFQCTADGGLITIFDLIPERVHSTLAGLDLGLLLEETESVLRMADANLIRAASRMTDSESL